MKHRGAGNRTEGRGRSPEIFFLLILMVYPMRHIGWGLDFWDVGYNYANFEYMGLEHMDSMWLFSTYLANAAGHFLTLLPFGGTLMGMNFYTGLCSCALAVGGYLFCTRRLGIPPWIAFVGEMVSLSLCWCPTALLYNYLTYGLLLLCVIFLYLGLTEGKTPYLFAAGICLGANVLVRFSNLPEAALIVAVWAYGVIEGLEERRGPAAGSRNRRTGENSAWGRTLRRTLWCLGGYLTAWAALFGYIHLRYGMGNYVAGIQRLFAMTEDAADYKAYSMVADLIFAYQINLYWVVRILFIVLMGVIFFALAELFAYVIKPLGKLIRGTACTVWCGVCGAMVCWLYYRRFCTVEYRTYESMKPAGILFLMLTMGIAVIRIFHRRSPREEKLISGLMILVVLITSIGSNNNVYPSLNNLFVAAPYTLWECWRFVRRVGDWQWKALKLRSFPVKGVLCAFLGFFMVQSSLFGVWFSYAEAKGIENVSARVENNEVLRGIGMSPERAEWMTELTAHVKERGLVGRDVILYGRIPSLSYYLQMPAAFNTWSELASYNLTVMERDMEEMCARMEADASYRPVVILEQEYALYLELPAEGRPEEMGPMEEDKKWQLVVAFLRNYGYEQTFRNEKFGVYVLSP